MIAIRLYLRPIVLVTLYFLSVRNFVSASINLPSFFQRQYGTAATNRRSNLGLGQRQ